MVEEMFMKGFSLSKMMVSFKFWKILWFPAPEEKPNEKSCCKRLWLSNCINY